MLSSENRWHFESLSELSSYLDRTPRTWRQHSSENAVYGTEWDLGADYDSAWNMARYGWLEGAQRAQQALRAFPPLDPAPRTVTDFYGHMPHVPRFCAGAPDSMIRHARPPRDNYGQVLTLIVPVNALGHVNAKYMANFGLGVAQYINQLEAEQVRVEVVGAMVSLVSGTRVACTWTIKRADQPLDLAVLAFAVGHPAMFRRLGFAFRERLPRSIREQISYGETVPAKQTDLINAPHNAFVLNGMANADSHARTPEQALEYIEAQIAKALETKMSA